MKQIEDLEPSNCKHFKFITRELGLCMAVNCLCHCDSDKDCELPKLYKPLNDINRDIEERR